MLNTATECYLITIDTEQNKAGVIEIDGINKKVFSSLTEEQTTELLKILKGEK